MRMESTRKLWLLILVGGCLLILQYHVSTSFSGPAGSGPAMLSSNVEGLLQAAVSKLQLDRAFTDVIGTVECPGSVNKSSRITVRAASFQ